MTISVNIHEAKAQLSHLLALARQGEEVVICNRNEPEARLVSVFPEKQKKRVLGLCAGEFSVPDSFFDPVTEEELGMSLDDMFPGKKK